MRIRPFSVMGSTATGRVKLFMFFLANLAVERMAMSQNKGTLKQNSTSVALRALRLQTVTQPELHAYVSSLRERYACHCQRDAM